MLYSDFRMVSESVATLVGSSCGNTVDRLSEMQAMCRGTLRDESVKIL